MQLPSDDESPRDGFDLNPSVDPRWEFDSGSDASIQLGSGHASQHGHESPHGHGSPEDPGWVRPGGAWSGEEGGGGFQLDDADTGDEGGFQLESDGQPLDETFPPGHPLHEDCRALVCRVHAAVQTWSPALLDAVSREQSARAPASKACASSVAADVRVAAGLLGIRPWRVYRTLRAEKCGRRQGHRATSQGRRTASQTATSCAATRRQEIHALSRWRLRGHGPAREESQGRARCWP